MLGLGLGLGLARGYPVTFVVVCCVLCFGFGSGFGCPLMSDLCSHLFVCSSCLFPSLMMSMSDSLMSRGDEQVPPLGTRHVSSQDGFVPEIYSNAFGTRICSSL